MIARFLRRLVLVCSPMTHPCALVWHGASRHQCDRGEGHRGKHWCACGVAGRRPRILS